MRRTSFALVMVTLLAACSGDGSTEATTSTSSPDVTTTAATETTISPEETTTTAAPTTTSTTGATTTTVDTLAPMGSGCDPGTQDLPDGDWYGGVREFNEDGFTFDLACLFTGEAAIAAAAADGAEPPPNDYYVRNENEQVREIVVPPDTPVSWFTSGDPASETPGTYLEWIDFLSTQESYLGIWLTVRDGEVTEIYEWWVP